MNIKVGQQVFLKPENNAARRTKEIKEQVILKVGRKYFLVGNEGQTNERLMTKFSIEDLIEVTEYSSDWKLYFSKQEILDEEESMNLKRDIRNKIDVWGKVDLTLNQLRRIKEIISE